MVTPNQPFPFLFLFPFFTVSFPTASNPRPTADDMEIVSLALTGLPRPHPFAMGRGEDAMEVCMCMHYMLCVRVSPCLIFDGWLHDVLLDSGLCRSFETLLPCAACRGGEL